MVFPFVQRTKQAVMVSRGSLRGYMPVHRLSTMAMIRLNSLVNMARICHCAGLCIGLLLKLYFN